MNRFRGIPSIGVATLLIVAVLGPSGCGPGNESKVAVPDDSAVVLNQTAPASPTGEDAKEPSSKDAPSRTGPSTLAAHPEGASIIAPSGKAEREGHQAALKEAQGLILSGKAREGLIRLTDAWRNSANEEERASAYSMLHNEVDRHVLSTGASSEFTFDHHVQPGDNLYTLCQKWSDGLRLRVSPGLILRVNGMTDPRRLRVGMTVRVPRDQIRLEVSKARYRLGVFLGEILVREFPVGIGPGDRTPEGEFEIDSRLKNPPWTTPNGVIPYGDPRNILGARWMGFRTAGGRSGLGIHGTTEPDSIGTNRSAGCVRMLNRDVEELFDIVPEGTKVRIQS